MTSPPKPLPDVVSADALSIKLDEMAQQYYCYNVYAAPFINSCLALLQQRDTLIRQQAIDETLERAAIEAFNGCLLPPDGGEPTAGERLACENSAKLIRALKGKSQ